jgi:hypothetical protein
MKMENRKVRSYVIGDLVWVYLYNDQVNRRRLGVVVGRNQCSTKQYDVYMFDTRGVITALASLLDLVYNIESKDW